MIRRAFYLLGLLVLVVIIVFVWPRPEACDCGALSFDQHDGVGTFVSFSRDVDVMGREPEVAPARIRARGGEDVTWVLRNPSDRDIMVSLHSVFEHGSSKDVLHEVFDETGGRVRIARGCQIAPLQARLNRDLLHGTGKMATCDSSRVFHYFFYIEVLPDATSKRDSVVCAWPYDPELVVERDP